MKPTIIARKYNLLLAVIFAFLTAQASNDSISYLPQIHGVLRGRWEIETNDGYSHFQVRNARVNVSGNAAPIITYMVNADLCDRGKIMLLDAYATVTAFKGFEIPVGQYRMPFGIESFRGPGGYYFNNRSFIGKHVNNYRAVGASLRYNLPFLPLSVEGGMFNPTVMDDQMTWVKKYAYAGRIVYKPSSFTFATGFESIIPDATRINLASATAGWACGNFYIEGEYMARWYTHNAYKPTHAYNFFANYDFPLRKGFFDVWSVQGRFDGMNDLASGYLSAHGKLLTTQVGRKRLTVGTTLDYKYRGVRAAVRLNFEKYWYDHDYDQDLGAGDCMSAELIVKF